jgi:hypothetical protein
MKQDGQRIDAADIFIITASDAVMECVKAKYNASVRK